MTNSHPLILAHGGAGSRRMTLAQAACLADALEAGYGILAQGGPALAAVECTIGLLEQSGLFNAGRGANRQLDGVQRMDAALMEGAHLEAGAIASIEGIAHPITAARLVMEETNHVLLVGPFAGRFARHFKLDRHRSTGAPCRLSYDQILARQKRSTPERHGTVGAVALDHFGTVAAGASTGGIDSMLPGRVGDSPLIGAGIYADNQSGAVSMTGMGEGIIRLVIAKSICDRLVMGKSPAVAARPCVAYARVSDPWVGWGSSPLAGRAICHQACDILYGCRLVERNRPADRSRRISMKDALFHLAFPTHDVAAAKRFYVDGLGCTLGRESSHAVTFGLAGHQLVAHLTTEPLPPQQGIYPHHFGLVFLSKDSWQQFLEQAQAKRLPFYQQPRVRFPGSSIEHHTFFLEDPSGNLLEFKHYLHESAIFGERECREVGDSS